MADDLGKRDAEQNARLRSRDAGEKVSQAHAGIDHNRDGAEFEKRESRGDQRQALVNHHECPVPWPDTAGQEPRAPRIDLGIELGEGEHQIIDLAGRGPAARYLHRGTGWLARSHPGQVARDVGGLGGHGLQARPNPLPRKAVSNQLHPAFGGGLHNVSYATTSAL